MENSKTLLQWDADLEARFTSPNFTIIILGSMKTKTISVI
jgi:hypothetical protein